jgi:hypothetical protein
MLTCDVRVFQTIKARFALTAAFDYVVSEMLMNFASAASRHSDFAQELPRFVDHCCFAWNKLIDMPWKIMSIGLRDWAHGF